MHLAPPHSSNLAHTERGPQWTEPVPAAIGFAASGLICASDKQQSGRDSLNNGVTQMTVRELKQRLDAGDDLFILDVREPFEYQIANLGGRLIPLNEIPRRMAEIDRNREIVVHCKLGGRSQMAAEFLAQSGYANVKNLAGGIIAWADQIDPKMKRY
jgi:rhodanese-related sulfurtransferase